MGDLARSRAGFASEIPLLSSFLHLLGDAEEGGPVSVRLSLTVVRPDRLPVF